MIKYLKGNILNSDSQALVNTVNTVGVMGKGIALQFKKAYPENYKSYLKACKNNEISIGNMCVTSGNYSSTGEKIIINFPTKKDWRNPSEYEYIESGLNSLKEIIKTNKIKSIALPPLGAGNGGLVWEKVKKIIDEKLSDLEIEIYVYVPTFQIKEQLQKEWVKLTNARALLLFVLYDLVKNGEFVSEFSSEKICYFLQKFGAEKYLKLKFNPNFYGPYSGKVRFLLNSLNGSYIQGFSDMNKKPFEPLIIKSEGYNVVKEYVNKDQDLKSIAENTTKFLKGFYSDFTLELLSSVDYISTKYNTFEKNFIINKLEEWSDRKRSMASEPKYIEIILNHIKNFSYKNN